MECHLHVLQHLILKQPHEGGAIINLILRMRKLRLTKLNKLAQGATASDFQNRDSSQSFWLQKLCFITVSPITRNELIISADFLLFHFCSLSLYYLTFQISNKPLPSCARHDVKRQKFRRGARLRCKKHLASLWPLSPPPPLPLSPLSPSSPSSS